MRSFLIELENGGVIILIKGLRVVFENIEGCVL